ncbi:hypothetical protein G4X40_03985 [Rhodococcus sp. D2-41]|uniref:DUF6779 domain-containing protein n=1 Tax=Speluncibacter jeojiensis TaxID=2710754 RepID=A0A9X4RFR7_9ACTN|nr:DUF6779 domain-containing protein [Rhodococcus sp. D2-41]MDG3009304.1 hypothetical protein [Rhodococcus sp. D2-41]MDG3016909.1 hypothetical protein [Corynebacteriales bacterium D3-21]
MSVSGRSNVPRQRRRSTARRDGRRARSPWQVVSAALIVLAVIASIIMIFSDSVALLRLAVVAAAWAAVLGAIGMTMYRKESESDAAKARDLKLVYELQLEREISARREYELAVQAQVRRELEEESSSELAALREELSALRSNLELLLGGELPDLVPAVRARADRVRELGNRERGNTDERTDARTRGDDRPPVSGPNLVQPGDEPWTAETQVVSMSPVTDDVEPLDAETEIIPAVRVGTDGTATDGASDAGRRDGAGADAESAADDEDEDGAHSGAHSGGSSVSELLARLQTGGAAAAGGGRRRRAE